MKEIRGTARASVSAAQEDCFSLLAAVDRYPEWSGDLVREVHVLKLDGEGLPRTARAILRVAHRSLELLVESHAEHPETVRLTRVPNEPSDQERLDLTWRLHQNGRTVIAVDFHALVSFLPRLMPVGGVGDQIARGLVEAAAKAADPQRE